MGPSPGSAQGTGRGYICRLGTIRINCSRPSSRWCRRRIIFWVVGDTTSGWRSTSGGGGDDAGSPSCILHKVEDSSPFCGKQYVMVHISHMSPSISYAISNEGTPYRLTAPDVKRMPSSFCPFDHHIQGYIATRKANTVFSQGSSGILAMINEGVNGHTTNYRREA